jgi:hypothetical protein
MRGRLCPAARSLGHSVSGGGGGDYQRFRLGHDSVTFSQMYKNFNFPTRYLGFLNRGKISFW